MNCRLTVGLLPLYSYNNGNIFCSLGWNYRIDEYLEDTRKTNRHFALAFGIKLTENDVCDKKGANDKS